MKTVLYKACVRENEEILPDERRQTEVEMPLVRGITDDQEQQDPGASQGVPQLVAIKGHAARDARARADLQKARERLLVHCPILQPTGEVHSVLGITEKNVRGRRPGVAETV